MKDVRWASIGHRSHKEESLVRWRGRVVQTSTHRTDTSIVCQRFVHEEANYVYRCRVGYRQDAFVTYLLKLVLDLSAWDENSELRHSRLLNHFCTRFILLNYS